MSPHNRGRGRGGFLNRRASEKYKATRRRTQLPKEFQELERLQAALVIQRTMRAKLARLAVQKRIKEIFHKTYGTVMCFVGR